MTVYPSFVIGVDKDGRKIEMHPDPKDKLIPVYFNPLVLRSIYEQPLKYSAFFFAHGMGGVSRKGDMDWHIRIGRNDEGFINAWLGDFAKEGLPVEDVSHWRAHNVIPQGGMPDDFYNAQLKCMPSKIPSLEMRLRDCRYWIKTTIEGRGKKIFLPYEGPDKLIENSLRIPLINDPADIAHKEFSEAIQILSKMFVEYLPNKKTLLAQLPKDEMNNEDGHIIVFSKWLKNVIGVPEATATSSKIALQNLQMARSKLGGVHRFSDSSYIEVINRLGLTNQPITVQIMFRTIAEPIASNLEEICKALGIETKLGWDIG